MHIHYLSTPNRFFVFLFYRFFYLHLHILSQAEGELLEDGASDDALVVENVGLE